MKELSKYLILPFLFLSTAQAVDFQKALNDTDAGRALAKNSGHAYCEMNPQGTLTATYNSKSLVPLASVSKVFISYWAVAKLGANYRFPTKLNIRAISSTQVDLHLEGSLDPFMGRQMIFFMMSELNRMGVKSIRHLSYDENFRLYLGVNEDTATEKGLDGPVSSAETGENLRSIFNDKNWTANTRSYYQSMLSAAAQNTAPDKVTLLADLQMQADDVTLIKAADYQAPARSSTILLQSAPLKKYLKQMNVLSVNYITDMLWQNLGKAPAFQTFFQGQLQLGADELQFFSGSGLPITVGGIRKDNVGTCEGVLKVLGAFEKVLAQDQLDLSDVMLVGGVDGGTLGEYYDQEALRGAVVAKTGTISTAKTFAGYVSTKKGKFFFGSFFGVTTDAEAALAETQRDFLVARLIGENGGKVAVSETHANAFIPFDRNSYFQDITLGSAGAH